jgi:hypothetical protein
MLSVIVFDARAFGGQARAIARIENYVFRRRSAGLYTGYRNRCR